MEIPNRKNKVIQTLIKYFYKIPKFRNKIYQFYAWKIFEFLPILKKILYKLYDKFWYLELLVESDELDLSKHQKNRYNIELERLQFTIDPKGTLLKKF